MGVVGKSFFLSSRRRHTMFDCDWSSDVCSSDLDPLALEEAERVRAGRTDAHSLLARDPRHVGAQLPQLVLDLGRRAADGRGDLQNRLHQLRIDAALVLAAVRGFEDGLDVLDEVERLAVEQHVLLLEPDRERLAFAEAVVEDTASGYETRSVAGSLRCAASIGPDGPSSVP